MASGSYTSRRLAVLAVVAAAVAGLLGGSSADAAFPGTNGKLVLADGPLLAAIEPDGTGGVFLSAAIANRTEAGASYSADGTRLAFQRVQYTPSGDLDGLNTGLFVVDVASGSTSGATKVPASETLQLQGQKLSLSPDGTKIALSSDGIVVVDVATGSQLRLTSVDPDSGLGADRDPAFSPDGTRIAFSREVEVGGLPGAAGDRQWHIHVMNADGTGVASLNTAGETGTCERRPSWSPDGTRIAFGDSRAWCEDGQNAPVTLMQADGSGRTALAGAQGAPVWSPDGTKVASSPGAGGVYVVGVDGSGAVALRGTGYVEDWQALPVVTPPPPDPGEPVCTIVGTPGRDGLVGTAGPDVICGLDGRDALFGGGGDDILIGGRDRDLLSGGSGDDRLVSADGHPDAVLCGPGDDVAIADRLDWVSPTCETVHR
jgi:Ca2+-binding RTX toxin-like protein